MTPIYTRCFHAVAGILACKREALLVSDKIDRELQASAIEHVVKSLLLGIGNSGKNTFIKQMKIIHGDGCSIDELNTFTTTIHGNLLSSMVEVIKAMHGQTEHYTTKSIKLSSCINNHQFDNISTVYFTRDWWKDEVGVAG